MFGIDKKKRYLEIFGRFAARKAVDLCRIRGKRWSVFKFGCAVCKCGSGEHIACPNIISEALKVKFRDNLELGY